MTDHHPPTWPESYDAAYVTARKAILRAIPPERRYGLVLLTPIEAGVRGAMLVAVYEGSNAATSFLTPYTYQPDYEALDRALAAQGIYQQALTGYSSAIYPCYPEDDYPLETS